MNKTVTINISGIIFHIEEDAYERLSKYLSTIKGYFSKTDGGNEIMSDIEARVAELLQEKINVGKQVILMADVEHVMQVMGKPEDFGAEQPQHEERKGGREEEQFAYESQKIKRRLFRNPDEKAIGGVCSGLAAYFDIDTVWVRLAMFFLIFFGGLSLWVYIIMWMIIPEAKTTADKYAMRGESANINNIMKNFKEEAEDVKSRFNKAGKEFKERQYGEQIRSGVASVLSVIFNILGRLVGFFILCIGLLLLFGYITSLMGFSIAANNADVAHWKAVLFESPSDYALAIVAFIIVVGIPTFMLVYAGIKLLFKVRYSNRWLNLSLGLVWLVGLIIGFYITISTVQYFNESSKIKETTIVHNAGDTIVIKMNPALTSLKAIGADNEDDLETYFTHNYGGFCFSEYDHKLGIIGRARLNVTQSNSDSVELVITQSSRGISKKDANENARAIKYKYSRDKNTLLFDEIFFVPPGNKFRVQEVDIRLRVPKGKVVYFDKSLKHMLDDVDNTTNTWDGDMISRRWIMTEKGLRCIDCSNLETDDDDNEHEKVEINSKGINVHNESTHEKIEINSEGINVHSENTHIKIDDDGIKIKTPTKDWEIKDDKKKDKKDKDSK